MKSIRIWLFAAAVLVLSAAGCASFGEQSGNAHTATVFAMDTVMEMTVYGGSDACARLLDEAGALIRTLEGEFSVTDPASEVYAVNQAGGGPVGPDTEELLGKALTFCERTGGALDVTVYPVVRAWGFTTGDYRVLTRAELDALLPLVDWRKVSLADGAVTLGEGQMLDLGAAAKGYAGDRLIALFREGGVSSAIVNLGGNVQTLGTKPDGSLWRVAVADPHGNGYAGILETADRAVVTSGGYERYFEKDGTVYRHIIDPATGMPADNGLASVTVVGKEGLICDALSTALFVMGEEDALAFWRASSDFEAVLLTEDGRILLTEGLADIFTPWGDWADAPVTVAGGRP